MHLGTIGVAHTAAGTVRDETIVAVESGDRLRDQLVFGLEERRLSADQRHQCGGLVGRLRGVRRAGRVADWRLKDRTRGLRGAYGQVDVQLAGGRDDLLRVEPGVRIHHDLLEAALRIGDLVRDHQTVRAVAMHRAPRAQVGHLNVQLDRTEPLPVRTVYAPDAGHRSIGAQLLRKHRRMQDARLVGHVKIAMLQQRLLLLSIELKVAILVLMVFHAQRSVVQNEARLMIGQVRMD